MNKLKIHIFRPSDYDENIEDITSIITIEDNLAWTPDRIDFVKETFTNMYDTKIELVETEREYLNSMITELCLSIKFLEADMTMDSIKEEQEKIKKQIKKKKNDINKIKNILKNKNIL